MVYALDMYKTHKNAFNNKKWIDSHNISRLKKFEQKDSRVISGRQEKTNNSLDILMRIFFLEN